MARSLRRVDDEDVDVVIVGRGGGSIEDLWAFNEELVARAVFDCETPVVSGVGHEVDTTITDHVADVRAATPSEAAEVTVPNLDEELRRIEKLEERMRSSVERMVESRKRALESHEEVLRKRPPVIDEYFQRLDELHDSLERSARGVVDDARSGVEENARLLESLSPLSVLSRGYSVVESDEGVVESVEDVAPGEGISVRLEDGTVDATVDETRRDG
ncbi:MAG: exodeoxyribonuclease VII large subunit [Halobacteria archaeon]|nr:exodeoxyribonuclease VII large subunit [Halobacteria archaeon]